MKTCIKGVNISGIAACLSDEISYILSDETVKQAHIAGGITTADLCVKASNHLIEGMDIGRESIDALVFLSTSPDYRAPATSCIMQDRLGLSTDTLAFDISKNCAAYVYCLYQAAMLIASGGCKRVLVCTGGEESSFSNDTVKSLLGNVGTATIIEKGYDTFYFNIKTDGSRYKDVCACDFYDKSSSAETFCSDKNIHIDNMGMDFFQNEIPAVLEETLLQTGWKKSEVETFAFNHINSFVKEYIANVLGISLDLIPAALSEDANTAEIPLLLCSEGEKLKKQNILNKVFVCGFGFDTSWGAVALNLDNTNIFKPIKY